MTASLRHLAVVMDGNGRWASSRGRPRRVGHRAGADAVKGLVTRCRERRLRYLTLYALSTENLARPRRELGCLMALLDRFLISEVSNLHERGVELRTIGDRSVLPSRVREHLESAEAATRQGSAMRLTLAIAYGGRRELTRAARALAMAAAAGLIEASRIDERTVERHLETGDTPPVDLLIRTGGERRLSNFLLWQAAYAELYFTATPWPDFDAVELDAAWAWYAERTRRFGGLAADTDPPSRIELVPG